MNTEHQLKLKLTWPKCLTGATTTAKNVVFIGL